ncbi:MAG: hypothetical protein EBY49_09000, partial [Actinobacteria bacterium]|nr:hypothetical protein [Actinomycetota bacterium]
LGFAIAAAGRRAGSDSGAGRGLRPTRLAFEITVGAFTNDHSAYVIDGEPIEASTSITVAS